MFPTVFFLKKLFLSIQWENIKTGSQNFLLNIDCSLLNMGFHHVVFLASKPQIHGWSAQIMFILNHLNVMKCSGFSYGIFGVQSLPTFKM